MSMMPLSTAMPLKRDEADARGDGERHVAQPQREDAAGDGQRDADEDERGLPHAAEAQEDQHEDEHQRHRHDDRQPRARLLQVLELPAELDSSSRAGTSLRP